MVVRIRLVPIGKKTQRSYQIKVIDSRRHRESGNYLENLGHWDLGQQKMELNREEYQKWLKWGAQPTDSINIRYNKQAIINDLENLPPNRIKIQVPEVASKSTNTEEKDQKPNNFQVKDLKKKLKENNYWLIKGVLLDKWEKGLVEKIFKNKTIKRYKKNLNNRFRIGKIFSQSNKSLGENEEVSQSLSPFNFEFSISLPKESGPAIIYTTKNHPISIIESKK
ncbi:MAG: 30S ribosomal protein S16 [Candidatus Moeniiplasma glomeromycotorum]|nr:30S ribosomal protein S16 [Candidatus Moeniiplasma glomeromycotorum]MCE8167602.1 30S ribosomal protein S16 [Candidatus Moeniiplasma glomeromycotorum]MCE8169048.1 30S ribosomal protein S16 [Candidatus Moeniiplasma glomeromycotorum]